MADLSLVAIVCRIVLVQVFRGHGRIGFVFVRVRRSDLLLAAIAVAGVLAGLMLTVAAKIGVTGPVLIGVGIVVAVAAAVSGIRAQVAAVVARQHLQSDRLDSILVVPVQALGEVDPLRIGVFPSALAQSAQRVPPVLGGGARPVPPYVPRGVDTGLRRALEEPSLDSSGRLVVLRGDPKSGKSRALWEAVRGLPGRKLLAVIQPDPAADPPDPGFAPLATLAGLDRPVSGSRGGDLVIWVDDAQTHLRRGLTRDTMRRLATCYPAAIIALAIHSSSLDALQDIDPPLHELLRRPFDDLLLTPVLSPGELASARDAYPALAGDNDLVRLPELFAAVNLLTDRYRHHRADEPAGVAVAKAAIDWQRAGMPPGSIDEPALRALATLTLQEIAPNRVLDDQAFERGLAWATKEVAAFAALIRRDPAGEAGVQRFRAFDGVVSWARGNEPTLGPRTWDFVLANASARDRLGAGVAAYQDAEWEHAIDAFQQAASSGDPAVAAQALFYKGVALSVLGRPEDEVAAYDQVVDRFGDAADPALAGSVAWALYNKGVALGVLGRPEDEVAAYDQVVDRFGDAADPVLAGPVAWALVRKGVTLSVLGRPEDAIAACDQVVDRFGGAADPALAEQVARALRSKDALISDTDVERGDLR